MKRLSDKIFAVIGTVSMITIWVLVPILLVMYVIQIINWLFFTHTPTAEEKYMQNKNLYKIDIQRSKEPLKTQYL